MFPNMMCSLLMMPGGISSTPLVISHKYVCIERRRRNGDLLTRFFFFFFSSFLSSHSNSHTYIHTLPQVSHVRLLCLNQLCHDESGDAHEPQRKITYIYLV